jgi:hypothetical protein
MRNRAQPFMKVALPEGASLLSVEVGGSPAKPVEGKDGSRVPLLRPGYRPEGSYVVSFVYLNAGTPFAKKGDMEMTLPKMDVPINVLEWELFVPDQYRVDRFAGNMMAASFFETIGMIASTSGVEGGGGVGAGVGAGSAGGLAAAAGQLVGRIVDSTGAPIPGVNVVVEGGGQRQEGVTDQTGSYVLSGLPSGPLTVTGQLEGFTTVRRSIVFDQRPQQVDMALAVGAVTESVTVTADTSAVNTRTSEIGQTFKTDEVRNQPAQKPRLAENEPSLNVQSLQRRASGVLPVRMDVPRAGTSHRFVKPLVIDEPTLVSFRYKRR